MRISDWSSDVCSSDLIEILDVDNAKVREAQIARINRIKAARDEAKAQAALDALRDGAKGKGNLLALAVDCARERCTLGEISLAMEDAFGRHGVDVYPVKGIYGRSEEHTSELQSLMRISYAVFCLKKKKQRIIQHIT